jgi:hypothetical protein
MHRLVTGDHRESSIWKLGQPKAGLLFLSRLLK